MNRFHVHIGVENLDESIRFYSALFGAEPTVRKDDYAKWMLDDPAVNLAISSRGATPGINHLGLQVDSDDALQAMRERARAADLSMLEEDGAACCYARSDKHWITDPSGVAWETFHSLESIPVFGAPRPVADTPAAGVCCPSAPAAESAVCSPDSPSAEARSGGCCG